jgi:Zn ribbon nucleic-acid-binding protein
MSQTQSADTRSLPKAGSTSRCPNCDAPAMAIKRWPQASGIWQVSCSHCGHIWQERTTRSFRDALRESPQKVVVAIACLLTASSIGFFVLSFAYPLGELADIGRPGASELGLVLAGAFLVMIGLAYAWRHNSDDDSRPTG